jgi:hypothetical protein
MAAEVQDRGGQYASSNPREASCAAVLGLGITDALCGMDPGWIGSGDFFAVAEPAGVHAAEAEGIQDQLARELEGVAA